MTRSFKLSDAAEKDLDLISRYTVKEWGMVQSAAYVTALDETFSRLCVFPKSGIARQDMGDECYILIYKEHRIYYQIQLDMILIIRVLHHTQQDVH